MNMDNSFIIKLFLNSKDVTEQYSVINAKIYRACNKIDKATISISADIIHQLKINSEQQTLFILECRGFAYPATLDVKIMYMKIVKMIPLSRRFWDNTGFPPK